MRGLRKLLVIGVTLGLYGSVVAPAHADTVFTFELLPNDAGIIVDMLALGSGLNPVFVHTQTDLRTRDGNLKFSIVDIGLQPFVLSGNYDLFLPFIGPSSPSPGGLLFVLSDGPQLPYTAYVWVHDDTRGGACTELCTVIDFVAGVFSVTQLPHAPPLGAVPPIIFTNDTGGLQEIGSYVNEMRVGEIRFMVQTPTNVVPLPAALPLFAGGLGLMGWMARRRRGQAAHA